MTVKGFWSDHLGGWVGQRPVTPDEQAEIDAKNLAAARAESARHEERTRPTVERTAAIKAELIRTVPADLGRAVLETFHESERLRLRVSETRKALDELQAVEPEEDELDAWLLERFRLENSIPQLQRMAERANQAYGQALEAGRRAVKSAAHERSESALAHLKAFEAAQRQALADEQAEHRIVQQACGEAQGFTAIDLETAYSGDTANDTKKGKR